jgi:hypothetical protein
MMLQANRASLELLDVLHRRPFVERLPDAQVKIQFQTALLRVEFVWELDLKRLLIDLDDRTLTPLEKIAQVVSKLGVAEPQSHPQKALPECPVAAVAYSHCHRERRLVNCYMSA